MHEGDEDPASLVGRLSDTSKSMVVFAFLLGSRGIGLSQHCGRVSRTVGVDLFSCCANLSISDDVAVGARLVGCNGGLARSSTRRALYDRFAYDINGYTITFLLLWGLAPLTLLWLIRPRPARPGFAEK